jgi:hypothetical protein
MRSSSRRAGEASRLEPTFDRMVDSLHVDDRVAHSR